MTDRFEKAIKYSVVFWLVVFLGAVLAMSEQPLIFPTELEVNWTCLSTPAASYLFESCSVDSSLVKTDALLPGLLIFGLSMILWGVQCFMLALMPIGGFYLLLGLEWPSE